MAAKGCDEPRTFAARIVLFLIRRCNFTFIFFAVMELFFLMSGVMKDCSVVHSLVWEATKVFLRSFRVHYSGQLHNISS